MKLSEAIVLSKNTKGIKKPDEMFNSVKLGQTLFIESNGTVIRGVVDSVSVNCQRITHSGICLGSFFESIVNDFSSGAEVTIKLRMATVVGR